MRPAKPETRNRRRPLGDGIQVPEGTPAWITPALIRETLATWQPYYRDSMTVDDAVRILASVGRLFEVLSRG
ncbi:MAG: hypothetical protein HUU22_11060 [Phycisphaerae bacterium]|nr:hypothetical protein [Phycisphaerae bacterium]NUQ46562.1 hypothetical protein [Phycisphaerae bacterium]